MQGRSVLGLLSGAVWAGLHYRDSMHDGPRLGRRVADLVSRAGQR